MRPTSEYNPKGKRAIITGGARGIGLEFADQLLRAGARVCICDIDVQGGKRVAEKLRDKYLVRKDRYVIHSSCKSQVQGSEHMEGSQARRLLFL